MSVLIIRKHSRFSVCRSGRLTGESGFAADGLVINLSQEGCRISNIADTGLQVDELTSLEIPGLTKLEGQVRWAHDGSVGLRFVPPLYRAQLEELVLACRGLGDEEKGRTARGRSA